MASYSCWWMPISCWCRTWSEPRYMYNCPIAADRCAWQKVIVAIPKLDNDDYRKGKKKTFKANIWKALKIRQISSPLIPYTFKVNTHGKVGMHRYLFDRCCLVEKTPECNFSAHVLRRFDFPERKNIAGRFWHKYWLLLSHCVINVVNDRQNISSFHKSIPNWVNTSTMFSLHFQTNIDGDI